jgi:hypothetical protein
MKRRKPMPADIPRALTPTAVAVAAGLAVLAACAGCERRQVRRAPPDAEEPGAPSARMSRDAGSGASAGRSTRPTDICSFGGSDAIEIELMFEPLDTIDLLFVVDDSVTMALAQAVLMNQFSRLIDGLSGFAEEHDVPARSVHIAVVSSDLGLAGVEGVGDCTGSGKDAIMQQQPLDPESCPRVLPPFLSFTPGRGMTERSFEQFFCISQLGNAGCGVQQPLEAALKALWPAEDPGVTFVGAQGRGHGDTHNAGFLRSADGPERSVLAIVVLSDKDDCSLRDPVAWAAGESFDPDDVSRRTSQLTSHCALGPAQLFEVERYVDALRSLRPDHERTLLFTAIAGVPRFTGHLAALIDPRDEQARDAFYDDLLSDPAMQISNDDRGTDRPDDDRLAFACEGDSGPATPAVRLVELARSFGANGLVQSICEGDLGTAVDAIARRIQGLFGDPCLNDPLSRGQDGLLACELVWSLPLPERALAGTPSACGEPGFEFLLPMRGGQAQTHLGGERCRMAQLLVAARDGELLALPTETDGVLFDRGWFYDDFSSERLRQCPTRPRRIAVTAGAEPPPDVHVTLECGRQAQDGACAAL